MLYFLIFLGVVQGITEFLPISSSGHLALFQNLPFFVQFTKQLGHQGMFAYDVFLHFATLLSVIIFFRNDIAALIGKTLLYLSGKKTQENMRQFHLALYIIIANLPIVVLGLLFKDDIEHLFTSGSVIAVLFIINGLFLFATRFFPLGNTELERIDLKKSLIIGIFQCFAILPGISRSGSTIGAAFLVKIRPEAAARFSFLLGLPPIAGAALMEAFKLSTSPVPLVYQNEMLIGMIFSFITGLLCLKLLVWLVKKTILYPFGLYTFILGSAALLFIF